ncbi:unnamed protein product [Caenorhabditis sp. 36 PRJEB53466]|nr:unnamed protein product [Caenorhabditis sp. 36 PRJEB53466]
MTVRITDYDHFKNVFEEKKSQPVILFFTASWCGPCQHVYPEVETLSAEHLDRLTFFKIDVDVDENEELVNQYDINSMPTFVLVVDGEVKEQFSGANVEKLRQLVANALA